MSNHINHCISHLYLYILYDFSVTIKSIQANSKALLEAPNNPNRGLNRDHGMKRLLNFMVSTRLISHLYLQYSTYGKYNW